MFSTGLTLPLYHTSKQNSNFKSNTHFLGKNWKGQIKNSLIILIFRTKIQEGDKNIDEVLNWYEEVNTQTLKYVTYSIHDSDISDFYRCTAGE